ncbi:MAG TPA: Fe-S cluster assembly ATPase SufC [Candidatus Bathyarchaeia archaeon]|nr:Fe-S cluster assembly ATPase SufC [Candidatus Bathyarchaeia archaeon]
MSHLDIKDLHVTIENKEILKGVDVSVNQGQIHAVMGPNGSGKSTLASTIMGHPKFKVTKGDIQFDSESILPLAPDARARKGLFLAFQYPYEVPGVSLATFLRTAYNAVRQGGRKGDLGQEMVSVLEFRKLLKEKLKLLEMDESFATRYLNDGFSGGEKKRCEILQLAILQPKIAVLDETDSGLDIDSVKIVAEGVDKLVGPEMGVMIITHYQRILRYITPDYVHILLDGRIVKSGGPELAEALEEKGYDWVKKEALN